MKCQAIDLDHLIGTTSLMVESIAIKQMIKQITEFRKLTQSLRAGKLVSHPRPFWLHALSASGRVNRSASHSFHTHAEHVAYADWQTSSSEVLFVCMLFFGMNAEPMSSWFSILAGAVKVKNVLHVFPSVIGINHCFSRNLKIQKFSHKNKLSYPTTLSFSFGYSLLWFPFLAPTSTFPP